MEQFERGELVKNAIFSLPDPLRTTASLYYVSNYETAEIADFLSTCTATVRKRLQLARGRMKP